MKQWYNFYKALLLTVLCLHLHNQCIQENFEKWVVITSIHYPTNQVIKLSTIPGWHVIVVADKKTPKDWNLSGCTFLSIEKQMDLKYRCTQLIPWNHYSRKNIGYLYAIEHGAQVIYDTDDDNIIIDEILSVADKHVEMLTCKSSKNTMNPCAYFGRSEVWPRGFPLDDIQRDCTQEYSKKVITTYLQQGMVNNDPDVDAIYRLTRKLPVFFHDRESVGLLPGTMAPFNSQNTMFHYEAFWGLVIPITPSFRVSDIWRGYWVQRVLWDIGSLLSFRSPSAIQERNDHSYLKDFSDELDLYKKSGDFISFLINWKSQVQLLPERIIELFEEMIKKEFFKDKEYDFICAWLKDLEDIGYKFPNVNTILPNL